MLFIWIHCLLYISSWSANTLLMVPRHIALEEKQKQNAKSEKAIPTELYCTAVEGSLAHYLLLGQPLLAPLPAAFCCCSLFLIITGCLHLVCCYFFFSVGLLYAELLLPGLIHNILHLLWLILIWLIFAANDGDAAVQQRSKRKKEKEKRKGTKLKKWEKRK